MNRYKNLEQCYDFMYLSNSLTKEKLNDIERKLDHYLKYVNSNENTIDEYKAKYGNDEIINWYEGLISTKDFVDENFDRELYNFDEILKTINNLENKIDDLNKKQLTFDEKYDFVVSNYKTVIPKINNDKTKYEFDIDEKGVGKNDVEATILLDINSSKIEIENNFNIISNDYNLFLFNYSKDDIKLKTNEGTLEI